MSSDDSLHSTLRVLMSPPLTLRTNISVFHGSRVSNFALELSRSQDGGLSVVELCPDGELLAGRVVAGPGEAAALDEQALTRAMQTLWRDDTTPDMPAQEVQSIRVTSLLMASEAAHPFRVVQSWYYRLRGSEALLDVWSDERPPRTRSIPPPASPSIRALLANLQALASA
ncbi:hypothetical protein FNU76_12910 [Chitinimonas arctica]|uniref:Uncharacterized protein n=1 Tax=Chitinimonas arctica TaxID=2594795 RepID=A0A516SG99_9NEIS|nr:hypothetical protein [Chitinimonas arctica]QDQ27189.1 hypothetical protein FNU76_12910 [Chitinimonas arctica]